MDIWRLQGHEALKEFFINNFWKKNKIEEKIYSDIYWDESVEYSYSAILFIISREREAILNKINST